MAKKLTIEQVKDIGLSKGLKYLPIIYINAFTVVPWLCLMCNKVITYKSVIKVKSRTRSGCILCNGRGHNHTIEDCHIWAKKRGGECLSTGFKNVMEPLLWRCAKGHEFWKDFHHIKQHGNWCFKCSNNCPPTIQDCHDIAKRNNGTCLSVVYTNSHTKLWWQCEFGHVWPATYNVIRQCWCPFCKSKSKQQDYLFNIIKELYPQNSVVKNYRDFDWLRTNTRNGKLELDIFVYKENFSLAIEYDGVQHFEPVDVFGGVEAFQKLQIRDKLKEEKIKQHRNNVNYFIRFNYKETLTKEYVIKKLINNNIPIEN